MHDTSGPQFFANKRSHISTWFIHATTFPFVLCRPRLLNGCPSHAFGATRLVEWVGVGSPVGEEQAEADGLEDASERTDGDGVEGTLLGKDLRDELQKYSISHLAK